MHHGYMSGFGNGFETEALPGALPRGRNSPQRCAYGLYAEQLSGSPFTAPRASNERSWLYRIQPTVKHIGAFRPRASGFWRSAPQPPAALPPAPLRWSPLPLPDRPQNLIAGMTTITICGDAQAATGIAAHIALVTAPMADEFLMNADAEMLILPQSGGMIFRTEFGRIEASPGEIVVIPRGVKFAADPAAAAARLYVCENYGAALTLPERGPIGANCLANPRDFLTPTAAYEDREAPCTLTLRWGGALWITELSHSPLDVVAWHGNYAPYKYDLQKFSPVGPLLFDHADPSIFTVLTSPSGTPGTANMDFVIFPDRWMVAENTFRPPWYHLNCMSEFMGLIYGAYDAKPEGFVPGGFSLHNRMLPHGPDAQAFAQASTADLKPHKLEGTMAFMFETFLPQTVTDFAATCPERQQNYAACWADLPRSFRKDQP